MAKLWAAEHLVRLRQLLEVGHRAGVRADLVRVAAPGLPVVGAPELRAGGRGLHAQELVVVSAVPLDGGASVHVPGVASPCPPACSGAAAGAAATARSAARVCRSIPLVLDLPGLLGQRVGGHRPAALLLVPHEAFQRLCKCLGRVGHPARSLRSRHKGTGKRQHHRGREALAQAAQGPRGAAFPSPVQRAAGKCGHADGEAARGGLDATGGTSNSISWSSGAEDLGRQNRGC
mmetsp:Transcript_1226/g.3463  ORF Transcript_1226/g.3463 Transcript_1226/m.3463 type:complete len:233 (+) Transcript_1226:922-1620(+)